VRGGKGGNLRPIRGNASAHYHRLKGAVRTKKYRKNPKKMRNQFLRERQTGRSSLANRGVCRYKKKAVTRKNLGWKERARKREIGSRRNLCHLSSCSLAVKKRPHMEVAIKENRPEEKSWVLATSKNQCTFPHRGRAKSFQEEGRGQGLGRGKGFPDEYFSIRGEITERPESNLKGGKKLVEASRSEGNRRSSRRDAGVILKLRGPALGGGGRVHQGGG